MRLKIVCQLANEMIDQDYRRKVMSLVKKGLEATNPELYQKLFSSNVQKFYTFSVFMKNAQFKESSIIVPDKQLLINFSTGDAELAVSFYNAFCSQIDQSVPFGENKITIQFVENVPQSVIRDSKQNFRTLSPIIVREHSIETRKDWFWSVNQDMEKFKIIMKANLLNKYQDKYGDSLEQDIADLDFEPIAMRKTVVRHYQKQIEGSIGTFVLKGAPYLLNDLAKSGVGSLTGGGFGHCELMD